MSSSDREAGTPDTKDPFSTPPEQVEGDPVDDRHTEPVLVSGVPPDETVALDADAAAVASQPTEQTPTAVSQGEKAMVAVDAAAPAAAEPPASADASRSTGPDEVASATGSASPAAAPAPAASPAPAEPVAAEIRTPATASVTASAPPAASPPTSTLPEQDQAEEPSSGWGWGWGWARGALSKATAKAAAMAETLVPHLAEEAKAMVSQASAVVSQASAAAQALAPQLTADALDALESVGRRAMDVMVATQMLPRAKHPHHHDHSGPDAAHSEHAHRHGSAEAGATDAAAADGAAVAPAAALAPVYVDVPAPIAAGPGPAAEVSPEVCFRRGLGGRAMQQLEQISALCSRQVSSAQQKLSADRAAKIRSLHHMLDISEATDTAPEWAELAPEISRQVGAVPAALSSLLSDAERIVMAAEDAVDTAVSDTAATDVDVQEAVLAQLQEMKRACIVLVADYCGACVQLLLTFAEHEQRNLDRVSSGDRSAALLQTAMLLRRVGLSMCQMALAAATRCAEAATQLAGKAAERFRRADAADAATRMEAEGDEIATSMPVDAGTTVSFIHDSLQLLASVLKLGLVQAAAPSS